ncbi:MAG: hypothetical protein GF309_15385 [Candidatus Lokiarchaeota archaeon]|nr:hypothetical protein [Candidatus Lokiarchaeota archaeon]
MEAADLNVRAKNRQHLDEFSKMAKKYHFQAIATSASLKEPVIEDEKGFRICKRIEVNADKVGKVKSRIGQSRRKAVIIAVRIGEVNATNWAANDHRVDLLTTYGYPWQRDLRYSTAKLAAATDTALEVNIVSLLQVSGLKRSRVLKSLRDSIRTASRARMRIVLSSGADSALRMRSPTALEQIGSLLDIDYKTAEKALRNYPMDIIKRNLAKLNENFIAPGIEIIGSDSDEETP